MSGRLWQHKRSISTLAPSQVASRQGERGHHEVGGGALPGKACQPWNFLRLLHGSLHSTGSHLPRLFPRALPFKFPWLTQSLLKFKACKGDSWAKDGEGVCYVAPWRGGLSRQKKGQRLWREQAQHIQASRRDGESGFKEKAGSWRALAMMIRAWVFYSEWDGKLWGVLSRGMSWSDIDYIPYSFLKDCYLLEIALLY